MATSGDKPLLRYDSARILTSGLDMPEIPDSQVAKILFLSIEPDKVSCDNEEIKLNSKSCIEKLIEKFKNSLKEKSMHPVQNYLKLRLFCLKEQKIPSSQEHSEITALESNFSDNEEFLTEEEEDILEFNEIFQMLSIPVPNFIRKGFEAIVRSKKIIVPRKQQKNSDFTTFFIYTESKILSEICDLLEAADVCRIFTYLKEDKNDMMEDTNDITELIDALREEINEETLKAVDGLKDVAFYFLILHMINGNILNRLHNHILEHTLEKLSAFYSSNGETDIIRLQESLNKLKRYPVSSYPPGLCIIFCVEKDRLGAEADMKIVKELFEKTYKYAVLTRMNPTSTVVRSVQNKLKEPRNKFYDSLVVWFMGHGTDTTLVLTDKEIQRRSDFIEPFAETEWLRKKPKLFFIQACAMKATKTEASLKRRSGMEASIDSLGFGLSAGPNWVNTYGPHLDISFVNNIADTLIANATKWSQWAARTEEGSLYVQTLVDTLNTSGHLESIENVLRKVHYKVNAVALKCDTTYWKQAPYYECYLQKEFVFPRQQ